MLLAAGRGERMGPLTVDRPKPLLTVAGRTLLDRQLDYLVEAGCDGVTVNVSYRADMIRAAVAERTGPPMVHISEEPKALETAGGIIQALPLLGEGPFMVVNADVITDFDTERLSLDGGQLACLMLAPNPSHHGGDFGVDDLGFATLNGPRLTYGGVGMFHPRLFEGLEPGYRRLRPVLEAAIQRREVVVRLHQGLWIDVGTPQRLEAAERCLAD